MGKKTKLQKGNKRQPATKTSSATTNPRSAYERLLASARAFTDAPVSHLSPSLCRTNVTTAMKAVALHLSNKKKLGAIDGGKIAALPAIAAAFEYAQTLVPTTASDGSIEDALGAVRPLRTAALAYLDAAAFCGLVDAGRVGAIHTGKGKLDVAKDAVAIAGMFADFGAALAGKHPFSQGQLDVLAERGAWLTERLKPSGAVRDKKARSPEATTKDRFGAMLEDAYAELEKLAVQVWGVGAFRDHIPALRAQERAASKASPAQRSAPAQAAS